MRAQTKKFNSRRTWPWGVLLVVILNFMGFAACNNDSAPPPPPPPPGPCTVACGGQNMIARAIGMSFVAGTNQPRFEMGLEFRGNFSGGQYNTGDPNVYGSYSGPVNATGWMSVLVSESSYFCPLFPGVYSVRPMTEGMWSGNGPYSAASFGGIRIEAVGNGHVIHMVLPNNFVYRAVPTVRSQSRPENFDFVIGNSVYILAVDNRPCLQGTNEYVLLAPGM